MSHSFSSLFTNGHFRFASVTIINYTTGGESFTLAEFNIGSLVGAVFGSVPTSANSLGIPLFPLLDGGKVKLFQFTAGSPVEIPTTNNLNAIIPAFIVGT